MQQAHLNLKSGRHFGNDIRVNRSLRRTLGFGAGEHRHRAALYDEGTWLIAAARAAAALGTPANNPQNSQRICSPTFACVYSLAVCP